MGTQSTDTYLRMFCATTCGNHQLLFVTCTFLYTSSSSPVCTTVCFFFYPRLSSSFLLFTDFFSFATRLCGSYLLRTLPFCRTAHITTSCWMPVTSMGTKTHILEVLHYLSALSRPVSAFTSCSPHPLFSSPSMPCDIFRPTSHENPTCRNHS